MVSLREFEIMRQKNIIVITEFLNGKIWDQG